MIDATVHMLTRDGEFMELCLRALLPYVKRAIVSVDSRSMDIPYIEKTIQGFSCEFKNIDMHEVHIVNPYMDLVEARNQMIRETDTKWVWVVDDDELYFLDAVKKIERKLSDSQKAFAVQCWAVWNRYWLHKATSKAWIERIFKRTEGLHWVGRFGKEMMYDGEERLWHRVSDKVQKIHVRYLHLTHVKANQLWRQEMNQKRKADGKYLWKSPEKVSNFVANLL